MKRYFYLILLTAITFIGCHKDDGPNNNNPYLPNYTVNLQVNMNLPGYSQLLVPGNGAYIDGNGVRGIIIFYTGSGYNAFDAACPNQSLSSCSTMTIDGINAICSCDEKKYNLFDGRARDMQYPMKQYRTSVSNNVIHVYN
ncbi:hypothetical protein FEDK69T_12740 [Flavobacterium enshiense DK69]|uniref:Rieske domain-containing protein n=1 Tax=Flavobacterium enshiense DK69 TaxID=1107311 RepID=V6S9L1_9FLAO|nr:hypothetical protein [Flavobacterium enshiense]ESU23124.1 hypothetical protein FEDK69T_12740 [Flavobacterium enshiense DK69]KGO96014.1 hypothetical protein Q767_07040 [Flavobacterium enshiense DK69]